MAAGGRGLRRWPSPVSRVLLLAALLLPAKAAPADLHPEVLIVVNANWPPSVAIGEYYRKTRAVPESNVLALRYGPARGNFAGAEFETIDRAAFEASIRDPVAAFLESRGLKDKIRIIVLAKGLPLHVSGAAAATSATYLRDSMDKSVDAELAILFSGKEASPGVVGTINPYFDSDQDFAAFRAAQPRAALRYLVARLDGYAKELDPKTGIPTDVKALIDRAQARGPAGTFLIDEDAAKTGALSSGNRIFLNPTAAVLRSLGREVRHDVTKAFVSNATNIAGYASWGSNDLANPGPPYYGRIKGALFPGSFAPRAIAVDLVSTNARTFAPPRLEAYGQSLIADLVHIGVSGAAGYVAEPVLAGCARPYILFRRYVEGVPAGEAYYRSIPYLGWVNVYVGDPLMTIGEPTTKHPTDLDGDGVPDAEDNCVEIPNPDQRDTDGDGIGNLCDPDVNKSGVVTTSWGQVLPPEAAGDIERIALAVQRHVYDPNYDLDGDGKVDETDLGIAQLWLFLPPGPSGRRTLHGAGSAAAPDAGSRTLPNPAAGTHRHVERDAPPNDGEGARANPEVAPRTSGLLGE